MRRIRYWMPWLFAGIALLLGFAAEHTIERFQRDGMLGHEREHVSGELSQIRAKLEGAVAANLLMVRGLTAVIAAEPDIDQARFAFFSRHFFGDHSPLRHIAGAPDMVVSLMHPMQGNEAAIGLDYRTHPTQSEAAMAVIEHGDTLIAGPLMLVIQRVENLNAKIEEQNGHILIRVEKDEDGRKPGVERAHDVKEEK